MRIQYYIIYPYSFLRMILIIGSPKFMCIESMDIELNYGNV